MLAAGLVMVWRVFGAARIVANATAAVVWTRGSNFEVWSVLAVGRGRIVLGAVSRQHPRELGWDSRGEARAPAGLCTAGTAGAFVGHRAVSETCWERKRGLLYEDLHWDPVIT